MFRKKAFSLGLILTTLSIITYFFYSNLSMNIFEFFELKTLDVRYLVNEKFLPKKTSYDVVIAAIDEKSLLKLGKWPWKRDIHGELIRKLDKLGVKSIGFDVSFTNPGISEDVIIAKKKIKNITATEYKNGKIKKETAIKILKAANSIDTSEDFEFAKAIKDVKNVSIGTYNIMRKKELYPGYNINNSKLYLDNRYHYVDGMMEELKEIQRTGSRRSKVFEVYKMIPPIDILTKFAYGVAPFDVGIPDPDGVLRGISSVTLESYSQLYFPPLYLIVYLNSIGYNMRDNVVLDLKKSSIDIYEDAKTKNNNLIKIPTNKDGYQRLYYYGKAHTFKYISCIDILEDDVDISDFKNKIALIGYTDTAKGLYDQRATPLDPNTPGVEVHATAIQNIIDKKFLRRYEIFAHILVLLALGGAVSLSLSFKNFNTLQETLFLLLILSTYFVFSYLSFVKGVWFELFYPIISIIFIHTSLTIFNYFGEEVEKKKIKNAFKHYTNPLLIEQLMKNPDQLKLGGENRVLTCFFSDIQGFTSISESMSPEKLVELLNDYLSIMTDIIISHDGMVDKYEGDAIMAIFGAPVPIEKHALKACLAALDYQEALSKFRTRYAKLNDLEIYARIGINSGDVIVGNMGSQTRFDYTVIGDEVNLASRLEGANKLYGTFIAISESTYLMVKDSVEVRELEIAKVKGKDKAVKIFELLGRKGSLSNDISLVQNLYTNGIHLYREKKWKIALSEFEKALDIIPDDGPSKLYKNRCIELLASPPEEWSPVYTFTTK